MGRLLFQSVIEHLEKLHIIYKTAQTPTIKILELEKAIESLKDYGETPIDILTKLTDKNFSGEMKKVKKSSFSETVELLFAKNYTEIRGTKINYEKINSSEKVVRYIENTPKEKVLMGTTKIDLQLLYCLLTGERDEIKKKNKNAIYEAIKSNIYARKRGHAFSKINSSVS